MSPVNRTLIAASILVSFGFIGSVSPTAVLAQSQLKGNTPGPSAAHKKWNTIEPFSPVIRKPGNALPSGQEKKSPQLKLRSRK
jgi:hypothetical protein